MFGSFLIVLFDAKASRIHTSRFVRVAQQRNWTWQLNATCMNRSAKGVTTKHPASMLSFWHASQQKKMSKANQSTRRWGNVLLSQYFLCFWEKNVTDCFRLQHHSAQGSSAALLAAVDLHFQDSTCSWVTVWSTSIMQQDPKFRIWYFVLSRLRIPAVDLWCIFNHITGAAVCRWIWHSSAQSICHHVNVRWRHGIWVWTLLQGTDELQDTLGISKICWGVYCCIWWRVLIITNVTHWSNGSKCSSAKSINWGSHLRSQLILQPSQLTCWT